MDEIMNFLSDKAVQMGLKIIGAIIFFLIGKQLIKFIQKIVKKSLTKAGVEVGAVQFVDSFLKAFLYVLLILMLAASIGVEATSIFALLGSVGVAVGLAIQGSLSNLAGGVLILLLKPFKVGDYIQESATGKEGTVTEIQIFYTKLLTVDNKAVILPNGTLANNCMVNITAEPKRRLDLIIGIAYNADIKTAKEVLLSVIQKDPSVLKDMQMLTFVDALDSSSVNLGVRCWLKQEDFWEAKWRITENCKLALDQAGIEIPFQQIDVHVNNME